MKKIMCGSWFMCLTWWSYDDALAAWLGLPALGHVPPVFGAMLLLALCLAITTD